MQGEHRHKVLKFSYEYLVKNEIPKEAKELGVKPIWASLQICAWQYAKGSAITARMKQTHSDKHSCLEIQPAAVLRHVRPDSKHPFIVGN